MIALLGGLTQGSGGACSAPAVGCRAPGLRPCAGGHEQGGESRALVVSYEPLHSAGMIAVCPITAARTGPARPAEVRIPVGEAGQTKPGLVLCHQVRTVSLLRARAEGPDRYLTDPDIRTPSTRGAGNAPWIGHAGAQRWRLGRRLLRARFRPVDARCWD